MVSDHEIANQIHILLTQPHPNSKPFTTLTDLIHHLSQTLGFDLSHKAAFIRDQINLLHFPFQHPQFHFPQHQLQTHHPHFVFQQQRHHQGPPLDLDFTTPTVSPPPPPPPPHPEQSQSEQSQVRPFEVEKVEGLSVENAVWVSSEKTKKGGTTSKRRGGPGGLNKLCGISPELQVIVGESSLSRTDVCKQLWAYIKKNNLQDPGNKRKIICDDALRVVFETDCTDMFKMNKLLAKHIIPLEPTKETSRKSKVNVDPKPESNDFVPCQVIVSETLADCLDLHEREMSESEALRLVWEYIKVNNLEDPRNPVMVLCDEKLKELFGCETISAMEIPQFLVNNHLLKQ